MQVPDVVVVGAATYDIDERDPRGWHLGGGVTYGALALARLGLRTGVVLGLGDEVRHADELDLLRDAGAMLTVVPLERGPAFRNIETPGGRVQTLGQVSDPVPAAAVPDAWRTAGTWLLAPIAAETGEDWASVPRTDSCVALAWQGLLRVLRPGEVVGQLPPAPSRLLARADIISVSRHDIPGGVGLRDIGRWLAPGAELLLTAGLSGGMLMRFERGEIVGARAYPSIPSTREIDPTGAGDTMLAGLLAARMAGGEASRIAGRDIRIGATAASALVEAPGMRSVPWLRQVRDRIRGSA